MPSLDGSLGAALLGLLAAAILFGVTNVQGTIYFSKFSHDSATLRYSVFLLWILDALQLALITTAIYTCAVTDFGIPIISETMSTWSLKAHVAIVGISNAIIRGLFCQRMWNLTNGNWILVIFIVATTTLALAGSIEFSIQSFAFADDVFHISAISWLLYVSLAAGFCTDLTIAMSLFITLRRYFAGVDKVYSTMAQKIVLYGISTGALTSACEISCLISYATLPDSLAFLALFFVLPKLLFNALLATLNGRSCLRKLHESYVRSAQQTLTNTTAHRSSRFSPVRTRFSDIRNSNAPVMAEKLPRLPAVVRQSRFRSSIMASIVDLERGSHITPEGREATGTFH